MGLLDEAIRQHLELKRQHGASDEELQMQEQEALGPVRREPAEPAGAGPDDAEQSLEPSAEDDVEPAYDDPPVPPDADAPVHEEASGEAADDAPFEPSPQAFEEPLDPYAEPGSAEAAPATEVLEPEEDLEAGDDAPSREFDALEQPVADDAVTGEDVAGEEEEEVVEEHEVAAEHVSEEDDDVLEETPDFLQETPEHDRLWFEQKPPRDFDFDE